MSPNRSTVMELCAVRDVAALAFELYPIASGKSSGRSLKTLIGSRWRFLAGVTQSQGFAISPEIPFHKLLRAVP
jgi:hypothetical protein